MGTARLISARPGPTLRLCLQKAPDIRQSTETISQVQPSHAVRGFYMCRATGTRWWARGRAPSINLRAAIVIKHSIGIVCTGIRRNCAVWPLSCLCLLCVSVPPAVPPSASRQPLCVSCFLVSLFSCSRYVTVTVHACSRSCVSCVSCVIVSLCLCLCLVVFVAVLVVHAVVVVVSRMTNAICTRDSRQ